MPFTFAHPAAVLPFLKKRYFSATGLIVGSIAPDFEYFLKMRSGSVHSHSLAGMFYFDLPISFLIAFLFHQLVKNALISNSPGFLQRRLVDVKQFDFLTFIKSRYWMFIYSALLGVSTHLVWDSFTHSGALMAEQIPLIMTVKVPFQGVNYPLWYTLQNVSSIVGLSLVSIYLMRLKPQNGLLTKPSWFFWLILAAIATTGFYLRYTFGRRMSEGNAVVAMVSVLLLGLLIAALVFRIQRRYKGVQ